MRIRAFPFHSSVASFIADHDFVYVVEQNRDAQLRTMIVNENGIDPVRLVPILHYDGTPITARSSPRRSATIRISSKSPASQGGVVMNGLNSQPSCPTGFHALLGKIKAWMAGTSPAMTWIEQRVLP